MIRNVTDDIDLTDHQLRVGDRVQIFVRGCRTVEAGEFARITRLLTYRIVVRLEGTTQTRLVEYRDLCYAPSPEEIADLCRLIQLRWSHSDRRSRAGLEYLPEGHTEPMTVPIVHDSFGASLAEYGRVD